MAVLPLPRCEHGDAFEAATGAPPTPLADAAGPISTIGAGEPPLPPESDRRDFWLQRLLAAPPASCCGTAMAALVARVARSRDHQAARSYTFSKTSQRRRARRGAAARSFNSSRSAPLRPLVHGSCRLLALSLAALLFVAGYLVYCIATLPFGGGLNVEATPSALVVEANDGQVFATRGVFKGEKLVAGDLPAHLSSAIVAIEDRRFYEHGGIDLRAIVRAAWRNLSGERIEGASTITQQLARMLYLSPERTFKRKVQEACWRSGSSSSSPRRKSSFAISTPPISAAACTGSTPPPSATSARLRKICR